jgi:hypothetical protein
MVEQENNIIDLLMFVLVLLVCKRPDLSGRFFVE